MSNTFIPIGAPVHRRILSRLETAMVARRNVLEIIPALSYRQPIVSGEMVMRWHMLADPAGMKRVADMIARSEFAVIPGCGHYPWAENPAHFSQVFFDFLARHVPAA